MTAENPVVAVPIRPKTADDQQRLWVGLQTLGAEDRAFHLSTDRDGRMLLTGMGELHLSIIIDRLKREFALKIVAGRAEVAYRETITAAADGEGRYVTHEAGRGHFAQVRIHVSPRQSGTGYVFANRAERALPDAIVHAIDEGVRKAMTQGLVAGWPVDDLSVDLCEAWFEESGASEEAFRMASATAFREAARKAHPVLLEPVMRVEITAPEEFAPRVMEDLARRRAEWKSEDLRGSTRIITVRALMSQMLGYGLELRQRTDGRGTHSVHLDGYARVERGFHNL